MATNRPVVLVTDGIHDSAKTILEASCEVLFEPKLTPEAFEALLPRINGLMVRSGIQVTAETMTKAPNLQIVGRAGVGTDNIDSKAATRRGVIVVNSPGGNTTAAAEHTIGMLMALARHIPEADQIMKTGGWRAKQLTGVELSGKTLGVVGFGKIGRKVARVFQRLDMNVLVYDPFLSAQLAEELKVKTVDLDTIFAESDFMTLHAPKTPETKNMINAEAFAKMKDGVRIVNCARGGIMDEDALCDAIESGKVAGAALDVFGKEPPSPEDRIFTMGHKIITTPHLGASTEEAQVNVAVDVAEQLQEFFKTGTAQNAVNIPALRRELLDPVRSYMPMAEQLGCMARQMANGGITLVEVVAAGTLSHENLTPLTLAVLKGMLGVAREGVNYVNAMVVAEEEGIAVRESRTPKAGNYANMLTVNLMTDTGLVSVAGSLISDNLYRIVSINGYPANLEPSQYILLAPHTDKPGMIASVSTILGASQINVSALQVARKGHAAGGESMMVFNLDNPVSNEVLSNMTALDGVSTARFIELPTV